ncbi:MAG: phosphate acyltransferase PlsX [Anaerolineae bacterium]|jgi:glycerol-3-phosphate acyltransferase PlsX|nr:phosphate acyltransferase PlsX [Anaerolineae bacterium]
MRIAVDAFGSDICPRPDVEGAVLAAREWGDEIILVGPEERIRQELAKYPTEGLNIRVVHAPDVLTMEDHSDEVRQKEDASIRVGMRLVKYGEADAFVSAGNTIAILSSAIFDLRRIRGIRRPALGVLYPLAPKPMLLLDMGATADPKPEYLLQFAQMGAIYMEKVWGIANPRVGLLTNGEEAEKGSMVVRDTHQLLEQSALNFIGNVEPKEMSRGAADVVVTDGFTGNLVVKTAESVVSFIGRLVKHDLLGNSLAKVALVLMLPGLMAALPGLLLLYPALRGILKRTDYAEYGGGLLFGVDGIVIVGHGRSNAKAIKNAIRQGREAAAAQVLQTIKAGLQAEQGAEGDA